MSDFAGALLPSDAFQPFTEIGQESSIAAEDKHQHRWLSLVGAFPVETTREELVAQFTGYYRNAHAAAMAFVRARAVGHPDIEGLVEDAFLLVWAKATQLGRVPDQPWLFQVLRNKIGDWYRSSKVAIQIPVDTAWFDSFPDETAADPEAVTVTQAVQAALDELAPDHREALLLCYWADQPGPEAARVAGVSADTYRKRLERARDAFKQKYLKTRTHLGGEHNE